LFSFGYFWSLIILGGDKKERPKMLILRR